ncbi:MAG: type II secretion system protein [Sulfurimicrobium sp.]|nr:type II secretion system protein [Sulfurimicrobium sp.]MDP3685998.1 type II secretion system protein [Sulfurimicrobium sp.]
MPRITATSTFLQRGFTLLEILVVLVIVSLASGILFQAMGQVAHLQKKFGVELVHAQQGEMLSNWFQQSIEGLLPDYPDGKNKFSGSERRLSGLTTNPLAAENGVPSPLVWELAFDAGTGETRLLYGASKDAAPVISWLGNKGKFTYLDSKGELHESWPPRLGLWPQLPAAIRVETLRDGEPAIIMAVPMGPANPLPRIVDIIGAVK